MATWTVSSAGTDDAAGITARHTRSLRYALVAGGSSMAPGDEVVLRADAALYDGANVTIDLGSAAAPGVIVRPDGDFYTAELPNAAGSRLLRVAGNGKIITLRSIRVRHPDGSVGTSSIVQVSGGSRVDLVDCVLDCNGANINALEIDDTYSSSANIINVTGGSIVGMRDGKSAIRCNQTSATLQAAATFDGVKISGRVAQIQNKVAFTMRRCTVDPGASLQAALLSFASTDASLGHPVTLGDNDFHLNAACYSLFAASSTYSALLQASPGLFVDEGNRIHADPSIPGWLDTPVFWDQLWNNSVYQHYPIPNVATQFVPTGEAALGYRDIALCGDSIMHGSTATDYLTADTNTSIGQLRRAFDLTTMDRDRASLGGLGAAGSWWMVDRIAAAGGVRVCCLAIGINNFIIGLNRGHTWDSANGKVDAAKLVRYIVAALERIEARGMRPAWLGMGSLAGSPPDNTLVETVNGLVRQECIYRGWLHGSWLRRMLTEEPTSWTTTYYSNLTSDVHPNTVGHNVIAREAAMLYRQAVATEKDARPYIETRSDGSTMYVYR